MFDKLIGGHYKELLPLQRQYNMERSRLSEVVEDRFKRLLFEGSYTSFGDLDLEFNKIFRPKTNEEKKMFNYRVVKFPPEDLFQSIDGATERVFSLCSKAEAFVAEKDPLHQKGYYILVEDDGEDDGEGPERDENGVQWHNKEFRSPNIPGEMILLKNVDMECEVDPFVGYYDEDYDEYRHWDNDLPVSITHWCIIPE